MFTQRKLTTNSELRLFIIITEFFFVCFFSVFVGDVLTFFLTSVMRIEGTIIQDLIVWEMTWRTGSKAPCRRCHCHPILFVYTSVDGVIHIHPFMCPVV